MKQHITIEQWNELSEQQKDVLITRLQETDLGKKGFGYARCLTIGQMIEFLGRRTNIMTWSPKKWRVSLFRHITAKGFEEDELCDALWEAVKKVLK